MLESGQQRSKTLFYLFLSSGGDPRDGPAVKRPMEGQNLKPWFAVSERSGAFIAKFPGQLDGSFIGLGTAV